MKYVLALFCILAVALLVVWWRLPREISYVRSSPSFTPTPTPQANKVSFIIGGDMMFGRLIAHTFLAKGLSTAVDQLGPDLFAGRDARVVNLEGPISDVPVSDIVDPRTLVFHFPPQTIDALTYLHINAVSQANNHSNNAGIKGLATTRRLLAGAGIQSIGGPTDADITRVASFTGQNLTLYIIGVLAISSKPNLVPLITQLKSDPNHRVIVFPHWGIEYQAVHSDAQQALAHAWIDAGADMVVGAHPHVIEDSELYRGKPIFYSLGNLLFDQPFSVETQQGLMIAGEFTDGGLRLFALPTQTTNLKPALMQDPTKTAVVQKIYAPFIQFLQQTAAGQLIFIPAQPILQ